MNSTNDELKFKYSQTEFRCMQLAKQVLDLTNESKLLKDRLTEVEMTNQELNFEKKEIVNLLSKLGLEQNKSKEIYKIILDSILQHLKIKGKDHEILLRRLLTAFKF